MCCAFVRFKPRWGPQQTRSGLGVLFRKDGFCQEFLLVLFYFNFAFLLACFARQGFSV